MNLFLRSLSLLAVCASLSSVALPAHALPTTNPLPGITGLGTIPTTDTPPIGTPEVSLSYERVDLDDGSVNLLPIASIIYGFEKGEVGATYVRESSDIGGFSFRQSYYALQGKVNVFSRQNTRVALGAHFYEFGEQGGADLGNVLSGYVTASVDLGARAKNGAKVHAGLLVQRARGGGNSDTLFRPFLGAEYGLSPAFSLAADYLNSDQNAARALSLSLRYAPRQSPLSAQIGVGRLRSDNKFFASLSYRFGSEASSTAGAPTMVPGVQP